MNQEIINKIKEESDTYVIITEKETTVNGSPLKLLVLLNQAIAKLINEIK